MEEYPVSFQDYTLFHFDEPFEQTEYCKQLDQPLNSKSILILTKSKASLPRVKKLAKAARIAGLEVYVREYFAKAFAGNKHVHPVEKKHTGVLQCHGYRQMGLYRYGAIYGFCQTAGASAY